MLVITCYRFLSIKRQMILTRIFTDRTIDTRPWLRTRTVVVVCVISRCTVASVLTRVGLARIINIRGHIYGTSYHITVIYCRPRINMTIVELLCCQCVQLIHDSISMCDQHVLKRNCDAGNIDPTSGCDRCW